METKQSPYLVQSILSDSCAIFIGAGLGVVSGLPTWNELLSVMVKSLGCSTNIDPLLIAQAYEISFGRAELNRTLMKRLEISSSADTTNYDLLAALPVRNYITTNYDNLLEDALRRVNRKFTRVVIDAGLSQWHPTHDTLIFKIHGSADAGKFIITENDYQQFDRDYPGAVSVLLHLLTTHSILFLGCSLTDPNFRKIYHLVQPLIGRNYRKHFTVHVFSEKTLDDIWAQNAIETIDLSKSPEQPSKRIYSFLKGLYESTKIASGSLTERQQIFERDEKAYLGDPHHIRTLVIRKETGTSYLGIPDDPKMNPFKALDHPEIRFRSAIERKETIRKYLRGGATLKMILSACPSFLVEKGYTPSDAITRIKALACFVEEFIDIENFQVTIRSSPVGDSQSTSYNNDVYIQSIRSWQTLQRSEKSIVIYNPTTIEHLNAMFDLKFTSLQSRNLLEADTFNIDKSLSPNTRIKKLLLKKLSDETSIIAANGGRNDTN